MYLSKRNINFFFPIFVRFWAVFCDWTFVLFLFGFRSWVSVGVSVCVGCSFAVFDLVGSSLHVCGV